jgi:hypothetical protein
LVVALYQYVNQRLSFAEHSQKEQAMILQQYIEESSYDIHYLKQFLVAKQHYQQQQQYDNYNNYDNITEIHDTHVPDIDTAIYDVSISNNNVVTVEKKTTPTNFSNRRLIPVSSDSENTTTDSECSESESESESESGSDSGSDSGSCESSKKTNHSNIKIIELSHDLALTRDSDDEDDTDSSESGSDTESSSDADSESSNNDTDSGCSKIAEIKEDKVAEYVKNHIDVDVEDFTHNVTTITETSIVTHDTIPDTITTSFDLAIDVNDANDIKIISDILDIQLDNTELIMLPQTTITQEQTTAAPLPETQPHITHPHANTSNYSGKSVSELRQLIKDKCKNEPEKLSEFGDIQKMKKTALLQIVEQL